MTANADITLLLPRYNDTQRQDVYTAVTVRGVWMHAVHKGGDNPSDEVRVRIPIDADFDGRTFCTPAEWQALDDDAASAHWTLAPGGYLLKGVHDLQPPISLRALMEQYGKVWKITEAADNRNGTAAVQHWRIKAV